MTEPIRTRAVSLADGPALAALFEREGSPCFCRFWHFLGDNNAWLERCANAPGDSRSELLHALASGSAEARGVVADADGAVVGWLKVAPATIMTKAYARRLYRNLPCFTGDRDGVFVLGCALVDARVRHRGVATTLVAEAVRVASSWGARALEAFPRRPREPVRDEELWTLPVAALSANGFVEVDAFEPYPVLRRELP